MVEVLDDCKFNLALLIVEVFADHCSWIVEVVFEVVEHCAVEAGHALLDFPRTQVRVDVLHQMLKVVDDLRTAQVAQEATHLVQCSHHH